MKKKSINRNAYLLPHGHHSMTIPDVLTPAQLAREIENRAELGDLAGWLQGISNRPCKGAKKVKITVTVEVVE